MITLKIEPYCNNCPSFDPKVAVGRYDDLNEGSIIKTIITCVDADKCYHMMEYLKSVDTTPGKKK